MISREQLRAYDNSLGKVEKAAERNAQAAFAAWRTKNLNAGIADIREELKALAMAELGKYGAAAGELAARFYDSCMKGSDIGPAAIPDTSDDTKAAIDRKCRYLVGRIADDGEGGSI